jgi:hypothetical protein
MLARITRALLAEQARQLGWYAGACMPVPPLTSQGHWRQPNKFISRLMKAVGPADRFGSSVGLL